MRKFLLLIAMVITSLISQEVMGQCGSVSLIGEFNGWAGDLKMTRDPMNSSVFTAFINVTEADDVDPIDGVVTMKFRENADWAVNWGSADFPTGIAVQDGANIPVPFGHYRVTFNCTTGEYAFVSTCGVVSMIGEFNGWSGDYAMERDPSDPSMYTGYVTFTEAEDGDENGIIEMKFRQDADWAVNWGSADFPTGVAVQDGANIPVPLGNYKVTFNCSTGEYNFVTTCGDISIIGEFNGWSGDYWMDRDATDPNVWTVILTLTQAEDGDENGIIELKFRQNADWAVNWGSADFPTGIGVQDGANIPVPLDLTPNTGLTTDYKVTFNCSTGEYNFELTAGQISMIGAFNNWNGDVDMNRDATNPNLWSLTRSWFADSEVKFRENHDWSNNWGNSTFPTGTGTFNGPNIPLVAGTYDITFNSSTGDYSFVTNDAVCGEIGMVGDFNGWGDDGTEVPTDVYLVRDPMYPNLFSLEYNFTSSTNMYFRMNAAQLLPDSPDVWGGTFPCGTGVHDLAKQIAVPGGKYQITFDCNSGDFCFVRLGNSVNAPEVFNILVDGNLNDPDWQINQPISQVIEGNPSEEGLNDATFGVAWNSEFLYIGISVVDNIPSLGDFGELFIDGDKSGGAYDDFDLELKFSGAGLEVVHGNQAVLASLQFAFVPSMTGYTAEVAIPWEPLGVTPESGNQIGFDIILGDDDTGTGVDYLLAWNGSLANYENTSAFGDLLFGTLSCGDISLYNATTGDVMLRNSPALPSTTYIATYDILNNFDMVFRKDLSNSVTWGNDAFPSGTATLNGASIPATTGLYRVQFDCLSGEYSFTTPELPSSPDGTALAEYTETAPNIDGDLSEYNLMYGTPIEAEGTGANNTVTWGALWDADGFYIGVHVVDASLVALEPGSPWQNDGIEMYVDGNNSKDGPVESAWDTQLIRDVTSDPTTAMWHKADGVTVTNDSAIWVVVSGGYNVEYFFGWDNIHFSPGKGRTIGWSVSNNDVDEPATARTNQTTWWGDGSNWSNTAALGNLQLNGGPFFVEGIFDNHVLYNAAVNIYPNPSSSYVNLLADDNVFTGNVTISVMDITGRTILKQAESIFGSNQVVQINVSNMSRGIYFVNVLGQDGKRAVKKLIVQ